MSCNRRHAALHAMIIGLVLAARPLCAEVPGALAYYPLDGSGTEATGNNINLNAIGEPTYVASISAGLGQALRVDGVNDALIGTGFVYSTTGAITLSAWARAATRVPHGSIFKNWNGQFHLGIDGGLAGPVGVLSNFINLTGIGGQPSVAASTLFPVGQWTHVAVVVNSAIQQQRLFMNGALVATASFSGTLRNNPCPGLGIGVKANCLGTNADIGNVPGFWHGELDEVAAWDQALTDAQIAELYALGNAGTPVFVQNQPPVASAGADLAAAVGERVVLDGSLSTDDETPTSSLQFSWSVTSRPSGSTATLNFPASATPQLMPDIIGEYLIQLVVTDGDGQPSTADTVRVTAELKPGFLFERLWQGSLSYSRTTTEYQHSDDSVRSGFIDSAGAIGIRSEYSYLCPLAEGSCTYSVQRDSVLDIDETAQRIMGTGDVDPDGYTLRYLYNPVRLGTETAAYGYAIKTIGGQDNYRSGIWTSGGSGVVNQLTFPVSIVGGGSLRYGSLRGAAGTGNTVLLHGSSDQCALTGSWTSGGSTYTYCRQYENGIYEFDGVSARRLVGTADTVPGVGSAYYYFGEALLDSSGDLIFVAQWHENDNWRYGLFRKSAGAGVARIADDAVGAAFAGGYIGALRRGGDQVYVGAYRYTDSDRSQPDWYYRYSTGIYSLQADGLFPEVAGTYDYRCSQTSCTGIYSYVDYWNFAPTADRLYFSASSSSSGGAGLWSGFRWKQDGAIRSFGQSSQERITVGGTTYEYASLLSPSTNGVGAAMGDSVLLAAQKLIASNYSGSGGTYSYQYAQDVVKARTDSDRDGLADASDNCPHRPNADQADVDADGVGDVCEDTDADGVLDILDNCPYVANADQADSDGDGIGGACDNCPSAPNPDQQDADGDGLGDTCDPDVDGDEVANAVDNCPSVVNFDQADLDADQLGDECDLDKDGDGIANEVDGHFSAGAFVDESSLLSDHFSDEGLGGVSFGHLASRGSLFIHVDDAPDISDGVLISSTSGSGHGLVKQCDFSGKEANQDRAGNGTDRDLRLDHGQVDLP